MLGHTKPEQGSPNATYALLERTARHLQSNALLALLVNMPLIQEHHCAPYARAERIPAKQAPKYARLALKI
jgi:hypothetical protein